MAQQGTTAAFPSVRRRRLHHHHHQALALGTFPGVRTARLEIRVPEQESSPPPVTQPLRPPLRHLSPPLNPGQELGFQRVLKTDKHTHLQHHAASIRCLSSPKCNGAHRTKRTHSTHGSLRKRSKYNRLTAKRLVFNLTVESGPKHTCHGRLQCFLPGFL